MELISITRTFFKNHIFVFGICFFLIVAVMAAFRLPNSSLTMQQTKSDNTNNGIIALIFPEKKIQRTAITH